MSEELKPCPFCGGAAHIERMGNRRYSTIYECGSCGCRLETGEEFNHGVIWNHRADQAERDRLAAENAELIDVLEKLARLGNEPHYGNSIGNDIARAALAKVKESGK